MHVAERLFLSDHPPVETPPVEPTEVQRSRGGDELEEEKREDVYLFKFSCFLIVRLFICMVLSHIFSLFIVVCFFESM